MTGDGFSLSDYRGLLERFLALGYQVRSYGDADPAQKHLVLRHDLDMSLQAAEPIAEIEAGLGVKGHYFVLLRTEMYNPFAAAARASLAAIRAGGHRLGLHLDASLYPGDPASLDEAADIECTALEAATGAPVDVISFHRPAESLLGYEKPLAGRRHAYEPCFFELMGYCSDSRGAWNHGHPLDHSAVREGRALQLLTHPIWWVGKPASPQSRLKSFLDERYTSLDRELAKNCSVHEPNHRHAVEKKTKAGRKPGRVAPPVDSTK